MSEPRSIEVMGERVTPVTVETWLRLVTAAVESGARRLFVSQNLHGMHVVKRDGRMRALHRAAHVVRIDGMPIVWIARAAGYRVGREERAGFMDLMHPLMTLAAESGWRVYVLAGRPGVAARAAEVLRERHPGLAIDTDDGYFDPTPGGEEVEARLARLRAFAPQLVLVGLGMPRQEHFLLQHADALPATALLTCGAAFDYVAGAVPMCPRWLSAWGLEWAYRLAAEPRRLARRYLVEPLGLLPLALRDMWRRPGARNHRA